MDNQFKEFRDWMMERDISLRKHIDERFVEMREYTDERSRDIETHLLTEFHKWAMRIESTIKPLPIRTASLEERVALIEERLKSIDRPLF